MRVGGALLLTLLSSSCVVPGDRYAGGSVSYGVGYYEPYGYDYGGWGPGYLVGPPRGDRHFDARRNASRTFRPAPPSHHMPSIPTHPRAPRVRSR